MGVALYKPGNTHTVNGIDCEMKVFDEYLFTSALDIGWNLTPEACYETEEQEESEETEAEASDEDQEEILSLEENKYYGDLSDGEVREIAKSKGIKHWHNKNIDKLRKEVDTWQPES